MIKTSEYSRFFDSLPLNVKTKIDYITNIIIHNKIVSTKFVKKLEHTDFYEMRATIDNKKIEQLQTVNHDLDVRYDKAGTRSRDEFDAKAKAWYYAECLKDARKKAGMTQQDVADIIGKKRSYVALIERGETDMQLSTFIMMSEAVGLRVALTY